MTEPIRQPVYQFEGFRLDAQHRVLFGTDGEPIALTPRLFDTLLYFVERAGQLLTKEQLLKAIWPKVVVEEHNLNKTVSELRRVLGEQPGEHKFIVTQPGRGYRFVADVSLAPSEAAPAPTLHADGAVVRPAAAPRVEYGSRTDAAPQASHPRRYGAAAAWGVAVVATAAALLALVLPSPEPALRVTPWSVEKGQQWFPAWSPDGVSTAFTIFGRSAKPNELVVRDLGEPIPRHVAPRPATAPGGVTQWTTTGKILFFDDRGLWSISPVGGAAEGVVSLDFSRLGVPLWFRMAHVTSDGTALAMFARDGGSSVAVWTATPPSAPLQKYDPAPFAGASFYGGPYLRFSPSGKQILVAFYAGAGRGFEAWLLPFPADTRSPPHRVLQNLPIVSDTVEFSWLPDDRHVVLAAAIGAEPGARRQLHLVDTETGNSRVLATVFNSPDVPVVSPDGSRVIVNDVRGDRDIITLDLESGARTTTIETDSAEFQPAWSAATNAMVYATTRSGVPEIWLHRPPQPDEPLLTPGHFSTATLFLFAPTISPDGTQVIVHRVAAEGGESRLWWSAVAGGDPELLTNEDMMVDHAGSWSPDGDWYVYWTTSIEGGQPTLKKVKTTGRAAPEILLEGLQFTDDPPVPIWSPDGQWILVGHRGLTLISADGRQASRHISAEPMPCAFADLEPLLYCIRGSLAPVAIGDYALAVLDLMGNELRSSRIPSALRPVSPIQPGLRLSLTPDRRGVTYAVESVSRTLWLVEGLDQVRLP